MPIRWRVMVLRLQHQPEHEQRNAGGHSSATSLLDRSLEGIPLEFPPGGVRHPTPLNAGSRSRATTIDLVGYIPYNPTKPIKLDNGIRGVGSKRITHERGGRVCGYIRPEPIISKSTASHR